LIGRPKANAGSGRGAATGTERRLNTGRYESGRDWTAYGARTTAPSPEYRADAGKPALRRAHAVGRAMPGAGGEGKKGMSHAWRRARLRRAQGKSERAQARPLYPQSHCPPPEDETTVTGDNTTAQATVQRPDSRRSLPRIIPWRQCTSSSWRVASLAVRRGRRRSPR
jgi:hypothetical protein